MLDCSNGDDNVVVVFNDFTSSQTCRSGKLCKNLVSPAAASDDSSISVGLGANWLHGLNSEVNPLYMVAVEKLGLPCMVTSSDDEPGDDVVLFMTSEEVGSSFFILYLYPRSCSHRPHLVVSVVSVRATPGSTPQTTRQRGRGMLGCVLVCRACLHPPLRVSRHFDRCSPGFSLRARESSAHVLRTRGDRTTRQHYLDATHH